MHSFGVGYARNSADALCNAHNNNTAILVSFVRSMKVLLANISFQFLLLRLFISDIRRFTATLMVAGCVGTLCNRVL